ncbi:MAG: glycosyl transferase family 2 [Pseudooceanicola sp.]|nr:glycosyl transferase family 2 [Pseudooceanicola sp.]
MNITAILTVRNEAAFLLEWVAHHLAAGVRHIVVYSNDCQDGTDAMLDRMQMMGWLTHVRNDGPYDQAGIQFTALKHAAELDVVKQADWLLPLDVDEFVNVHVGDNTLPALISALPHATAITLTWRLFGNAEGVEYRDRRVTHTFTRCAPVHMHWPWRAAMFKTLYRNDGTYSKLGVHRPRGHDKSRLDQARWFDGEGRELDQQFKVRRIFSNYGRSNYKLAQLNHYPLGAMQSFVLKSDRGRAVHSDDMLGADYWVERNFNTENDTSVNALDHASEPVRQALLADPVLGPLHKAAVDWRHERFTHLMQREPMRALFARLLMAPASRPISVRAARGLTRYAMMAQQSPSEAAE